MQILHRGDLNSYLSSLVSKERDSLGTNSASIMDLIHICEHKLNLRNIEFDKRYGWRNGFVDPFMGFGYRSQKLLGREGRTRSYEYAEQH